MDVSILLVFIVVFLSCLMISRNVSGRGRNPKPPGPWGFPIVGHLPLFGNNLPETFSKWRQKYGDVFRIRMGRWETIVINGHTAIKEAFETCGDAFSSRPEFETVRVLVRIRDGSEDSLVFGKFTPAHVLHRKIVAGALRVFTKTNVNDTQEIILDEARKMIDEFLSWNGKPNYIENVVRVSIGSITYQIFYNRVGNIREDKQFIAAIENSDELTRFAKSGNPVDVMPWLRFFMPWKMRKFVELIMNAEMIRQKIVRQHMSDTTDAVCTVANIFLKTNLPEEVTNKHNSVSKKRLMSSLNDLVGAGFDTTYTLLRWIIMYMIVFPEVQKRVHEEIDSVIGSSCRIEIADRSRLNFTWATILEVMRITTIVPFALPHSPAADTEISGFRVDKNCVAIINLHSIHMDEEFWKDPKTFRPGRLLDKDNGIAKEMANHIVPFGLGRRKCIGEHLAKMELFLIFSTLMQRCSFSRAEGDILSTEPLRELIYRPKPFRAIVTERN